MLSLAQIYCMCTILMGRCDEILAMMWIIVCLHPVSELQSRYCGVVLLLQDALCTQRSAFLFQDW